MRIRSGAVWTRRNWIRSGFDPDRMCSVEGPLVTFAKHRTAHALCIFHAQFRGTRKPYIYSTRKLSVNAVCDTDHSTI